MKRAFALTLLGLLMVATMASVGLSADTNYKSYQRENREELYFELMFDEDSFGYSVEHDDVTSRFLWDRDELHIGRHEITVNGVAILDKDGLVHNRGLFEFERISKLRIVEDDGWTVLKFYTRLSPNRSERIRRGNLIEATETVTVEEDDFVRGLVFSLSGDVDVYGEINEDVIALFGNIFIGPDAVVRGDVVSVTGDIDLAHKASVYGTVYSGTSGKPGRRYRFRRRKDFEIDIDASLFHYGRVDGLAIGLGQRFKDSDSILPMIWASGGYAFESERWRYELGLEQTILRSPGMAIGATAYRRLASDDGWLLSGDENNIFALLAAEDFRDYYEAEGGRVYLRLKPMRKLIVEGGYAIEKTKWLDGQPKLWSLFGSHKDFAENFASVDPATRAQGAEDIDSLDNGWLYGTLEYDTRDEDDPYHYSGWGAAASVEWSSPDFDSDYDYTRYRMSLSRNQLLNRRIMLLLRGTVGGSTGSLPMHKQFYLGGLGTLHGYRHKEYAGDKFWMVNAEYRTNFPRSDMAASLFADFGQIANGGRLSDAEVKSSAGVSLYFGSDFKLSLARRLDRSEDNDPKFYVRFAHAF